MTELDSQNSVSPAESAVDEGLSPRAAAEAKKAAAAKAAAAAFIQSAEDEYGTVEAAQPRDVKKGHRTAIIIGLVICVLVAAAGLAYLFTSGFFNDEPVAEETQRVPLSDARVLAAFDEVTMDAPDITQYAYVSQDALIGPKFSDIVLNEPTNLGAPGNQIVTCEATATATFKNKGIEINVPVTLPFEYSDAGETWVPGELTRGEATATPLASANASDILANLNDILAANDPTYGEAMADASIVKTTSDLTIDGGPITAALSKTVESEADGVTTSELRTSTVTLNVAWSNTEGWIVSVADAGQIEEQTNQIPAAGSSSDTPASVDPANADPENLGTVKYGDTVTLAGTLQAVEGAADLSAGNNYTNNGATENANGSVQLVLKLNRPVDMSLNGTQYRLTTIAVATSGLDDNGKSLIGRKADVKGPLEESFATSWSPAGIKALEIHVE
ncbi:hypothetical protein VJ923_11155 [Adlercreutzia sp. R25]|uniref:hypothetical protein n=1 Tax=Adlercreutzia shanghongiae TaxID=3111773 RepID=UPI002DB5718F|nr:hypothetical protein [Adlercreutzia sp. R25]MEC4273714.1 hypothetical protein [Adlercreutzia sp. R25]